MGNNADTDGAARSHPVIFGVCLAVVCFVVGVLSVAVAAMDASGAHDPWRPTVWLVIIAISLGLGTILPVTFTSLGRRFPTAVYGSSTHQHPPRSK